MRDLMAGGAMVASQPTTGRAFSPLLSRHLGSGVSAVCSAHVQGWVSSQSRMGEDVACLGKQLRMVVP